MLGAIVGGCGEDEDVSNRPFDAVLAGHGLLGFRLDDRSTTSLGRADQVCGWSPDRRRVCTQGFDENSDTLDGYYNGPVSIVSPDGIHHRVRDRFTWSPDGAHTALVGDSDAFIGDANGARQVAIPGGSPLGTPVWSPDGSRVALRSPDGIVISNLDATEMVEARLGAPFDVKWSPDGVRLMVASGTMPAATATLSIVDAGTGTTTTVGSGVPVSATFGWSADGAWFAFGSDLRIVSADGATLLPVASICLGDSAAWSPVEPRLAFLTCGPNNRLVNWSPDDVRDLGPGHGIPTWSPDGSTLVYTGLSSSGLGYEDVLIDAFDGTELARFPGTPGPDRNLAWNADGSALLFIPGPTGEDAVVMDPRGGNGVIVASDAFDAMWLGNGTHVAVARSRDAVIARADGSGFSMRVSAPGHWVR